MPTGDRDETTSDYPVTLRGCGLGWAMHWMFGCNFGCSFEFGDIVRTSRAARMRIAAKSEVLNECIMRVENALEADNAPPGGW